MWYVGGKFRQSKAIVECFRPVITPNTVYVEPFCGGMWSATRVIHDLHPKTVILNDINKPLMLLWEKCIKEGVDWLPIDTETVEREHGNYRRNQDMNDPLTAWYGIALSFGGKWFGGVPHHNKGCQEKDYTSRSRSMYNKIERLRECNDIQLLNIDYHDMQIPNSAVVYLDPPYEGTSGLHISNNLDYLDFWEYARQLSKRCFVLTSCFKCPEDFGSVYEWGDTILTFVNSKGPKGVNEKLVIYKEGVQYV